MNVIPFHADSSRWCFSYVPMCRELSFVGTFTVHDHSSGPFFRPTGGMALKMAFPINFLPTIEWTRSIRITKLSWPVVLDVVYENDLRLHRECIYLGTVNYALIGVPVTRWPSSQYTRCCKQKMSRIERYGNTCSGLWYVGFVAQTRSAFHSNFEGSIRHKI